MPSPKPKPTRPKTQPAIKPVTQYELEQILDEYNELGEKILAIRGRLERGALVEPGEYIAVSNAAGDPIASHESPVRYIGMFGLDLSKGPHPETDPAQNQVAQQESWSEQYARRNAEIGAELVIAGLADRERAVLAMCQKIYRLNRGCTTPFEQFVSSLVSTAMTGEWPTPDMVEEELGTFRDDWDSMRSETSRFIERYPETREESNA